jgi:translation initiation factor IF-3
VFDQSGNDCGIMPQVDAMKLANDAGFNLYFMETEAEPPVAIFTTKDQSRELGQRTFESGRRVVTRNKSEATKNHTESKSPVKQTNSSGSKNLAK